MFINDSFFYLGFVEVSGKYCDKFYRVQVNLFS